MNTRALALAALASAALSCTADNHVSVEMQFVCPHPAPDTASGSCLYPATCDLQALGRQYVYLDASPGVGGAVLWVPVQTINRLPDITDLSAGRLNTNDAFIEEFQLSYESAVLTGVQDTVFQIAYTVESNGTREILVPAIPLSPTSVQMAANAIDAAGALVVVHVKASGHYGSGDRFTTGEFLIPVQVYATGYPADVCPAGKTAFVCLQIGQTHTTVCN